jgi:hypothetical protein
MERAKDSPPTYSESTIQLYHHLKKTFSCAICLDIIQRPTSVSCCQNTFCSQCINRALQVKEQCPFCQGKVKNNKDYLTTLEGFDDVCSAMKKFFDSVDSRHLSEKVETVLRRQSKLTSKGSLYFDNDIEIETVSSTTGNEESASTNTDELIAALPPPANHLSLEPLPPPPPPVPPVPKTPKFCIGSLVNVLPRTWSGINKLGGVGKVEAVTQAPEGEPEVNDFIYTVKYELDRHKDTEIPEKYLTDYQELDRSSRKRNKRTSEEATDVSSPANPSVSTLTTTTATVSSSSSARPPKKKLRESTDFPTSRNSLEPKHYPTTTCSSSSSSSAMTRQRDPSKPIHILLTCIEDKNVVEKKLEELIKFFSSKGVSIQLEHQFNKDVTHILVSMDENGVVSQRTLKYMQGIAYGCWILSTNWIQGCLDAKELLLEEKYEVVANAKGPLPYASRRSREVTMNPLVSSSFFVFRHFIFLLHLSINSRVTNYFMTWSFSCMVISP